MSPALEATPTPDFTAVKRRQQSTRASGDFSVVAARIVFQAEHLCETADVPAGWRVLDWAVLFITHTIRRGQPPADTVMPRRRDPSAPVNQPNLRGAGRASGR